MRQPLSVSLLGPWEIRADGTTVHVPVGRLRTLLTSLVLAAGEPVGLDVLAEQVWPERLPGRARATLHTYVGRLRKLLGPKLIHTHPGGGYLLELDRAAVDLHRFRDLLCRAEHSAGAEEAALLREALDLWRGRPFADMYSTWLDRDVLPRLTEEWFAATARRIDLELATGHPERLVAELRDLTSRFPTREALWARLITALHRSGRRAEALTTYQEVRELLSDELGMDPSEQLVALQRAILLDGTAPPDHTPRQLPHDVAHFTGRDAELAALDRLVDEPARPAPTIVSIDGAPGVGKTTLAVHWAHDVATHCPEVQLYLNLRGYGPGEPVASAAAAEIFLRALGVERIPADADERFAALRTALAGRRALILLDNARDADQVRPLLPGTAGLVIVTSRNQLRGLSVRDGAHRVTLHRLPRHQSVELLATAIGHHRVAEEPVAAARLADLCDHLPLALAIVAERAHRTATLGEVVTALAKARLDNLDTGENDPHADLRAALSWSYRALRADAAAMFRKLGLHPACDLDVRTAAAIADVPVQAARVALDQLIAAHLVEQHRPGRYELHDLIRLYAQEAAYDEYPVERDLAVRRMLDWYLHGAAAADRALAPGRRYRFLDPYEPQTAPPSFAGAREAWAWFEEEYDSLRAVVAWAAASGWSGHAWRTALTMTTYFDTVVPWQAGREFFEAAHAAARSSGEIDGEAYTLNSLGCLALDRSDWIGAVALFERALARFRAAANPRGEALVMGNLALAHGELGNGELAKEYSTQALALFGYFNEPRGIAMNLDNLGVALTATGEYRRAVDCHLRAQAICVDTGDHQTESCVQHHLAHAYVGLGNTVRAIRAFRAAIELYRRAGNVRWEAFVRAELGRVVHRRGHPQWGRDIWTTAVTLMRSISEPLAQELQLPLTDETPTPVLI